MPINKLYNIGKRYNNAHNGTAFFEEENKTVYLNAHFVYKGVSVIVDYEHTLHIYKKGDYDPDKEVPVEMYSKEYGDYILEFVRLDDVYKKVDMVELIKIIEKAISEMEI